MSCFWADERGQATTEYILVLSFVTMMVAILSKRFVQPFLTRTLDAVTRKMEDTLFRGDLHTLRIGR